MLDAKAYRGARENLLYDLLGAAGLVASLLPAEVRPGSKLARLGGSQWINPDLKVIADKIADVTHRFDMLQHALVLGDHDSRFGHSPAPKQPDPKPRRRSRGREQQR